jgi:hypothetical protein
MSTWQQLLGFHLHRPPGPAEGVGSSQRSTGSKRRYGVWNGPELQPHQEGNHGFSLDLEAAPFHIHADRGDLDLYQNRRDAIRNRCCVDRDVDLFAGSGFRVVMAS